MIAAAAAVVASLAFAGCSSSPVPPPPDSVGTPLDLAVPGAVATLPLIDSTGHRTDLTAFDGKVLVVSDMMTLCQETCPLDTANIVATARQAERAGLGDKVEFVSITIDPVRDTTARLAAYRQMFAPAPADWAVLGGSTANVAALWKFFGLYYEKAPEDSPPAVDWMTGKPLTYDISHADLVFFFGANGHLRYTVDGTAHVAAAADLPSTLEHFLSAEGRDNLRDPGFGSWTVGQALQVIGWLTDTPIAASGVAVSSMP